MANAKLHARQEDGRGRRVELIMGRRHRGTAKERTRIVTKSFEEGAKMSEAARFPAKFGIIPIADKTCSHSSLERLALRQELNSFSDQLRQTADA
jgi:hypothetical protein